MTERGSEGVSEEMRVAFRFRLQASERAAVCSGEMDGWIDGHSSQRTACFSAMPAAPPAGRQAGRQRGRQASPLSGDRACEIECVIREFVQLDRQLVLKFSYMFCP